MLSRYYSFRKVNQDGTANVTITFSGGKPSYANDGVSGSGTYTATSDNETVFASLTGTWTGSPGYAKFVDRTGTVEYYGEVTAVDPATGLPVLVKNDWVTPLKPLSWTTGAVFTGMTTASFQREEDWYPAIPEYKEGNPDGTSDPTSSGKGTSPTITSTPTTTATIGSAYSYTATTSDGSSVVFWDYPAWLSFSGNTISGTPTTGAVETVSLYIQTDTGFPADPQTFNITVTPAGTFAFTSSPTTTATVGTAYSYAVTVTAGTISAATTPGWSTWDTATSTLSGTPVVTATDSLVLNLYDGVSLEDTQSASITVNPAALTLYSPTNMTTNNDPAPYSTDNLTWGGSSSSFGADAYQLFDGDESTEVVESGGPGSGSIFIDLGATTVCTRVKIKTVSGYGPQAYELRGYKGTAPVDTLIASGTLSDVEGWQTVDFPNTTAYQIYGFLWSSQFSPVAVKLYEVEWYGP
jgi:hypothetical protein